MIRRCLGAVMVAFLAAAAPSSAAAQQGAAPVTLSGEAQEAAKVVDAFHAALNRNEPAAALALLADDALIFEGGYAERSRAEYASHHASADAAYASAVSSSLSARRGGVTGDIAWIASESRATGTYRDKPVDRSTTESMILRREGGGWLIVHIHWSSRPAS